MGFVFEIYSVYIKINSEIYETKFKYAQLTFSFLSSCFHKLYNIHIDEILLSKQL